MADSLIWLKAIVYAPARKEIQGWPVSAKKELGSVLTKLQIHEDVGFPDTKPMNIVALGWQEIRVKCSDGIYRAFYIIKSKFGILVFHSFQKKTQKTPLREIETGKRRLISFIKELEHEKN